MARDMHITTVRHLASGSTEVPKRLLHQATVALGSNIGDRVAHIEASLARMKTHGLKVLRVSHLYETKAMYYEDQASFLNAACLVETSLEPLQLLDLLQQIEIAEGRVKLVEKGPRTLDLDIITYDSRVIDHARLRVPHPLMLEREFVLRPLADISPDLILPQTAVGSAPSSKGSKSVKAALGDLKSYESNMSSSTIIRSNTPLLRADDPARTTRLMAVMNITPDSFSDGGRFSSDNGLTSIIDSARQFIAAGATILDVGGQSTRPNAEFISAEEELGRVLPVIEAIRAMPEANDVAISVDTFHSEVARRAAEMGADIINDVSGGSMDPNMARTVAETGKSMVVMHMRGTPHTMTKLTKYPRGVINGVSVELEQRVQAALAAGIPPWRIILDSGIGFAKTMDQNIELLRHGHKLREHPAFKGYTWLVGTSRKGFIGKVTGVERADQRQLGTAATITAAIAGGADIVRVHDVKEMVEVCKMADAIYRSTT